MMKNKILEEAAAAERAGGAANTAKSQGGKRNIPRFSKNVMNEFDFNIKELENRY